MLAKPAAIVLSLVIFAFRSYNLPSIRCVTPCPAPVSAPSLNALFQFLLLLLPLLLILHLFLLSPFLLSPFLLSPFLLFLFFLLLLPLHGLYRHRMSPAHNLLSQRARYQAPGVD